MDGESVAYSLGYDTFEAFLQSPEMAPRIIVAENADGAPLYKVYPTKSDLRRYVTLQLGTDYGDTKYELIRSGRTSRKFSKPLCRCSLIRSPTVAR